MWKRRTRPSHRRRRPRPRPRRPDAAAPAGEPAEFLPLDAERTEQIRADLKRQRVAEEMTRRIAAADEAMFVLNQEIWAEVPSPDDPGSDVTEAEAETLREAARAQIAERMTAYAEERGLTYERLPLLSVPELTGGDYPVAEATNPTEDQFRQARPAYVPLIPYATPLFGGVRIGEAPDRSAMYALWKTDQRLPGRRELTDEGVRENVVAAFRRREAAKLAAERAEALAKLASAEGKTLEEVAAGQTVTGEAGGEPLTVKVTEPWIRLRADRPTDFQTMMLRGVNPTLVENPAGEIGPASREFLDAAFDALAPGEAAAAPAVDPDRWFTLELLSREPTNERLAELYDNFLKNARDDRALYQLAGQEARQATITALVEGLFDRYGIDREEVAALARAREEQ